MPVFVQMYACVLKEIELSKLVTFFSRTRPPFSAIFDVIIGTFTRLNVAHSRQSRFMTSTFTTVKVMTSTFTTLLVKTKMLTKVQVIPSELMIGRRVTFFWRQNHESRSQNLQNPQFPVLTNKMRSNQCLCVLLNISLRIGFLSNV